MIQRVKSSNGAESEASLTGGVHKLNGNEQCNDSSSPDTSPKSSVEQPSHATPFPPQVNTYLPVCNHAYY